MPCWSSPRARTSLRSAGPGPSSACATEGCCPRCAAPRRGGTCSHRVRPGLVAALRGAPHADVVFVAHTGLEHVSTVRDLWRGLPMDKTLHLRWWFVAATEVPRDETQLTDWLYHWWLDAG